MRVSTASPVRVIVMTTVPETLEAFFQCQLRSLAEAGFEVHAVSSPGAGLNALGGISGVTVHAIPMERKPHPVKDCVSLLRLIRLFRRVRPHIVHAHTPKAGLLGMTAAKVARVPARLYTVHGLPLLTRSGLLRRVLKAAERMSARLATRTYSVSQSVRQLMIEMKLCSADRVSVLGDGSCAGVDLNRFNADADWSLKRMAVRSALNIPRDAVLVSFVGRLARDKGIGVLAAAWPGLARELPHLHLLLAGDPDRTDPLPASLFEQLLAHGERVHLTGSIAGPEVPAIYAASDIFVLPTFREGLSQVALEAGAMGVPIVSCQVSGLDAVQDGVTGLLVPPGNPVALANAIASLATNPEFRNRLGVAAKKHVRDHYSEERVNRMWMSEYQLLVRKWA